MKANGLSGVVSPLPLDTHADHVVAKGAAVIPAPQKEFIRCASVRA
jgi:hypothetical protein